MTDLITARARCTTLLDLALDDHTLVPIDARAGDLLRSDAGTVWATMPGHPEDILLRPGQTHRVAADVRLLLSGFGPTQATLARSAAARAWP